MGKDGTLNRRNHGGVAIYLHQDIPYTEVELSTSIQAIAVTVFLKTKFTICNIYSSRNHSLTANNLMQLYNQLPQPCMLLGDFNAYSVMWGCHQTDTRGRILQNFIDNTGLSLLNNGAPTHPNMANDTAIDLSICSPRLSEDFEWNTLPTVLDSDHYPIVLSTSLQVQSPFPVQRAR